MICQTNTTVLNLKTTIIAIDSLEILLFNREKEIINSVEYKEEKKVTYQKKLLSDGLKPIRTVKKHLSHERDLLELDLFSS